jgi:DNA polymerase I
MHAGSFELQWFGRLGIEMPNGKRLFDTRGAAATLEASGDAGVPDLSLEAVAQRYLGVRLDKSEQRGDWSGELTEAQVRYAARDATVLLELYVVLAPQLAEARVLKTWEIEMRCLPAAVWCRTSGVPVKKDAWIDQAARAQLTKEEAEEGLNRHLAERGVTTERWQAEARRRIKGPLGEQPNWQSSEQVQAVFACLGHQVESVSAEKLAPLAEREPLARLYTAYNQVVMKVKTYGVSYLRHLNPATGRLHPHFDPWGTTTGRFNCSGPNMQNLPNEHAYRCLIAPETDLDCFLCTDYSQAELRVLAQVTRDPNLIAAFNEGRDLHRWIMAEVLGKAESEVTELERKMGKTANFGFCYGLQPESFVTKCQMEGIPMTLERAHEIHAMYFRLFGGVKEWQDLIRRSRDYTTRTLSGRRRLRIFGDEERFNTPIQGTAADCLKIAMALMWERRHECPEFQLIGTMHDEILGRCPVACWEKCAAWLQRCMEDGMRAIVTVVPVKAEIKAYKDWKQTPLGGDDV